MLLDRIMVAGPMATVMNFDTREEVFAKDLMAHQQLHENHVAALLPYTQDPLYIIPEFLIVDNDGQLEIADHNSNHPIHAVGWQDHSNTVWFVDPRQCYDIENLRPVML